MQDGEIEPFNGSPFRDVEWLFARWHSTTVFMFVCRCGCAKRGDPCVPGE
jgi:hypothetical protein